ncbi:MAG: M28 family peptidase [Muribaculaceae bacterium]|nr:M28 family peptidase [Muribaculaceae bacterium]
MTTLLLASAGCIGCSAGKADAAGADSAGAVQNEAVARPEFSADSAYAYVERLLEFGPRVPNTEAHRRAGDWLAARLHDFGWEVVEQKAVLTAFDGTPLQARNIMGRLNSDAPHRTLLLAHWDSRPWADEDPDPAKREMPVLGANDGASGIGVLLEIARRLALSDSKAGIDILFVDAEDWGSHADEESWALGTRYFAQHPPVADYHPAQAILLDMVGSPDARFGLEYFSSQAHPGLQQKIWSNAARLGHSSLFHSGFGGAITDDHVELIKAGIPAVDIIDYRDSDGYQGFDPVWHTTNDNLSNISPATLKAVGETVLLTITE